MTENVTLSPIPLSPPPTPRPASAGGLSFISSKDFYILNNKLHKPECATSTPALKMSIIYISPVARRKCTVSNTFCLSVSTSLHFPRVRRDWFVWRLHKILITMQVRFLWDMTSRQNRKSKSCHEALYSESLYCIVACLDDCNHADMINATRMPNRVFLNLTKQD